MSARKCKLTVIASPHLFFLVYEDEEQGLAHIQASLDRDFSPNVVTAPKNNTLYVIQDKERTYKRAMFLKKDMQDYSCLLVDHGRVLVTRTLYNLPRSCDMKPLSFKAGLNNTAGLESRISDAGLIEYFETTTFSTGAVNLIKSCIINAKSISFMEENVRDNVHYGQLILTRKDNSSYNLVDYLCREKVIVVNESKFNEALEPFLPTPVYDSDDDFSGAGVGSGRPRNAHTMALQPEKKFYIDKWLKTSIEESDALSHCTNLEEDQFDILNEAATSPNKVTLNDMKILIKGRGRALGNMETSLNRSNVSCKPTNSSPTDKQTDFAHSSPICIQDDTNSSRTYKRNNDASTTTHSAQSSPESNLTNYHIMLAKLRERLSLTPVITQKPEADNSSSFNSNSNCSDFLDSDMPGSFTSGRNSSRPDAAGSSICSDNMGAQSEGEWKGTTENSEEVLLESLCNLAEPHISDDDIPMHSVSNKKNLLKIGCSCSNCVRWSVSDFDTVKEDFVKACRREVVKPFPLLKTDTDAQGLAIKSMAEVMNELPSFKRIIMPKVLTHGPIVPFPQRYVKDVPFIEPIHHALRKLDYIKCKPIQMYSWPTVMRNMNLCVTHSGRSGKTMVYIPAICSFMLEKDRYANLPKGKSPIAIILCPESRQVEDTNDLILTLMKNVVCKQRIKIAAAFPPLDLSVLKQFSYPCDILIATPTAVLALLSKNVINLKRMCHLIVENIDVIFEHFKEPFESILDVTQQMLEHRICANQVQFICTSEHWTRPLENFVKLLHAVPIICIGSHVESALYGRADIQVLDTKSNMKASRLHDILKDIYRIYKTVVICKQTEIMEILNLFQLCGIRMTITEETMNGEDIIEAQKCWLSTPGGENLVLICTDLIFNSHLNITSASLLINYSLPETWGSFVKRWGCLIDNYKSPLGSSIATFNCKVITFVDENCEKEFPFIANYFQSIGTKLPNSLVKFCETYKQKQEEAKICAKVKLCTQIKEFGRCTNTRCQLRHQLSPDIEAKTQLMMTGQLKFRINNTRHINRYLITPIEYENPDGKVLVISDMSKTIGKFIGALRAQEIPDEVKVNLMYIFEEEGRSTRCIVRKILEYDRITRKPCKVLVEGLDVAYIKPTSTLYLYDLPESLKRIPPVLKELIVANIIPLNNEKGWTLRSRKLVIKELDNADYKDVDMYCVGNILLELGNTIWVEDLHVQKYLSYLKNTVNKFTLRKFLLGKNLIKSDSSYINRLYDLCTKYEIVLPKYMVAKEEDKLTVGQTKPQWAHLPHDSYHSVYFSSGFSPNRFYVRLVKFDQLLKNLQHLIREYVAKNKFTQLTEADLQGDKCFLAPDPEDPSVHSRVLIKSTTPDLIDCFFVDFGDLALIKISEIKPISDYLITKLPFQAIECSLFGVAPPEDTWSEDSIDILYQYCYEKNTDFFRTLYVHKLDTVKGHFTKNNKYGVLFYDYSDDVPILINKILIDCGMGIPMPNESMAVDFDLVKEIQDSHDDYDGDEEDAQDEKKSETDPNQVWEVEYEENRQIPSEDSNSDFEFEINDESNFFIELGLKVRPASPPKASSNTTPEHHLPQITAAPLSDTLSPEVIWYQTNKLVRIEIRLSVTKYEIKLIAGRMLTFQATYDDKKYDLKLQLYEAVNKVFSHTSQRTIKVVIYKLNEKEWPRLVLTQQSMRNIKYDLDKCVIPDEEDSKRPFLHIGDDLDDEIVTENIMEVASDSYSDSDLSCSDSN